MSSPAFRLAARRRQAQSARRTVNAAPVRHFVVATAGHVDHGKSALVRALTGTDPDRLPEEKARGITIDLGFAHLELPEARLVLSLVDVPGHEDFVKNMVAGVGSVDLALFVVAADDGWMPQSEEHLQILDYLGVTRAVVALTKIDLVPGRETEAIAAVRSALASSPFASAPLVPLSALTGQGVETLKLALAETLSAAAPAADLGKPRLPVDRVFSLKGVGTVVTGTLTGGTLRREQRVCVQPAGLPARIRNLQSHNQDLELAEPGRRVAVNLPDMPARAEGQTEGVARGDVLADEALGGPTDTADVELVKSARLAGRLVPAARPLKDRTRVRVHFGTANCAATVFLHGAGELPAGGRRLAQLRFETPVFLGDGDRFIIRDWSEQATLAGGLVLDCDGDRKHWQRKPQVRLLEIRAAAPADVVAWTASLLERDGVVRHADMLRNSRFSAAEIAAALQRHAADERAVLRGEFAADARCWQALLSRAAEAVDAAHRAHPEWPGLPLGDLRAAVADSLLLADAFDTVMAALCEAGFVVAGNAIRRQAHRPALPARLQATGDWLRQALAEKPLDPPSRKELTHERAAQEAMRFLVETGEAVEVGPDLILTREAYNRAVEEVRRLLRARGRATVSELRQALGCTRRIMVPLCEKLDANGVTRREGDHRRLR